MEPETHDRLRQELRQTARHRRIQNAIIGISILVVVTFATLALFEIRRTSDYLKECTTPSTDTEFHRCYEDGQQRTQEAVQAIVDRLDYNAALQVCLLSIPPDVRTDRDIAHCEREAGLEEAP